MGRPIVVLLGKNIVKIMPRQVDPAHVLRLQTNPETALGIFLHNGQVNGTTDYRLRIHNTTRSG